MSVLFGPLSDTSEYAGIGWYLVTIGAFVAILLLLSVFGFYFKFIDNKEGLMYNDNKKRSIHVGDLMILAFNTIFYIFSSIIYLEMYSNPQVILIYLLFILPLAFNLFGRVRGAKNNPLVYYGYGIWRRRLCSVRVKG